MHTICLPSLKTKSWWVISSATAFVFFFLFLSLFSGCIHCGEAWGEGRRSRAPSDQGEPKKGETPQLRCGDEWQKKKGGKGKREKNVFRLHREGWSLSLSLSLIIYYCLLFCHSFSSLLYISSLLTCLFLSVFLSWTFFFSCLACRLALLFLHFLFFFKSPTPWIYRGRTEKWGSTDSFFLFVCFLVTFALTQAKRGGIEKKKKTEKV